MKLTQKGRVLAKPASILLTLTWDPVMPLKMGEKGKETGDKNL
jgi:hypothetical protein